MLLISIVLPVYNAVNLLEKAVFSIINQTYGNWELLLINDGSTDGSDRLAADLAKKDDRIKFFTQINKGVSAARNLGLQHVTGDYVMFVDADDWIAKGMLNDIIGEIEQFKGVELIRLISQKVTDREKEYQPSNEYIAKQYKPLDFIQENLLYLQTII